MLLSSPPSEDTVSVKDMLLLVEQSFHTMRSTLRLCPLHHSEDISIEDMLRFEQSCLRLDVRQCDTSRPDDKTRILRAVCGEGREGEERGCTAHWGAAALYQPIKGLT